MKKFITVSLMALLLQGCFTAYQSKEMNGGYSETQLDKNRFKVSFVGNGYTSKKRVIDFALLRSSEIAMLHGYKYFSIVSENDDIKSSAHTPDTAAYTTNNAYDAENPGYDPIITTKYSGKVYKTVQARSSNTIVLFKEKPERIHAYDAAALYKSMTEKYDIEKKQF